MCNCIKKDVCKHRNEIIKSVNPIFNGYYGGEIDDFEKVTNVVEKECRFRVQISEKCYYKGGPGCQHVRLDAGD